MEKKPYDFIDSDAPEKRETNRKFAEAHRRESEAPTAPNSSSNSVNNSRDKTTTEGSDKGGSTNSRSDSRSDSPLLCRVINKLFGLFE